MVRWATNAIYETTDLVELESRGILGLGDAAALTTASTILSAFDAIFTFMPIKHTTTCFDRTRFALRRNGVMKTPRLFLAVELFMANYFHHSTAVADGAERFIRANPATNVDGQRS